MRGRRLGDMPLLGHPEQRPTPDQLIRPTRPGAKTIRVSRQWFNRAVRSRGGCGIADIRTSAKSGRILPTSDRIVNGRGERTGQTFQFGPQFGCAYEGSIYGRKCMPFRMSAPGWRPAGALSLAVGRQKPGFHRGGEMTPKEFAAKYVRLPLGDYVCLGRPGV